jgi:hypothetical protein
MKHTTRRREKHLTPRQMREQWQEHINFTRYHAGNQGECYILSLNPRRTTIRIGYDVIPMVIAG